MNMPDFVKNKYVLYGGLAIVSASLLYKMMTPKQGDIVMTAEGMSEGNLAMVVTAQEFALKAEQLKAEKEIALQGFTNERYITDTGLKMLELNNAAYASGLEANNQFALSSQISAQDYELAKNTEMAALSKYFKDAELTSQGMEDRYKLDSQGMQLSYENAWKSAEYADKASERAAVYNLANYQTMVGHDIGKKQVGVQKEAGRLSFLGSVASLFSPAKG